MSTLCTFTIDLAAQRFTVFEGAEPIFGVDAKRILTDLDDFRRLPPEKYARAIGLYFSRPDEVGRFGKIYAALSAGSPCEYHAHMRNAATRQFTLCKVSITPSADGKTAQGIITPEE